MKRNIDLNEVTDGKKYKSTDLVRLGSEECKGCSACCKGMGSSIVLDPYDIYQMTKGLQCTFQELLKNKIELNIQDELILPNLALQGREEACGFLNVEGRCSIHAFRPGFCRLFPLGRVYENNNFDYILLKEECKKTNRSKVRISKWLDIPDLRKYEKFVLDWHYFLKNVSKDLREADEDTKKKASYTLLTLFYQKPYDHNRDFYEQFYERKNLIG